MDIVPQAHNFKRIKASLKTIKPTTNNQTQLVDRKQSNQPQTTIELRRRNQKTKRQSVKETDREEQIEVTWWDLKKKSENKQTRLEREKRKEEEIEVTIRKYSKEGHVRELGICLFNLLHQIWTVGCRRTVQIVSSYSAHRKPLLTWSALLLLPITDLEEDLELDEIKLDPLLPSWLVISPSTGRASFFPEWLWEL